MKVILNEVAQLAYNLRQVLLQHGLFYIVTDFFANLKWNFDMGEKKIPKMVTN